VPRDAGMGSGAGEHPLGPLWSWGTARYPWRVRAAGAVVLLACLSVFVTAGYLRPTASGIGSHTQLGLAPCSMPMLLGIPCPTCGMTTSFAHFVRGDLLNSFHAQPAGFVLALGVVVVAVGAGAVIWRGRGIVINWYRIRPGMVAVVTLVVLLFGWAYKLAVGIGAGSPQ